MGKDFIESIGIRYGNEGPKMPPIRRLLAQGAASLHRAVIAQTRACGAARARGTDRHQHYPGSNSSPPKCPC